MAGKTQFPRTAQGLKQAKALQAQKRFARERTPEARFKQLKKAESIRISGFDRSVPGLRTFTIELPKNNNGNFDAAIKFDGQEKQIGISARGKDFQWHRYSTDDYLNEEVKSALDDQFNMLDRQIRYDQQSTMNPAFAKLLHSARTTEQ